MFLHLDEHVDRAVEIGQRPIFGRQRRLPHGGVGELAQPTDAGGRTLEEQRITRQQDHLAFDVGDPHPVSADRHDAHARRDRKLERAQRSMRHVRTLAHHHAVRHLLGVREVRDQLPWDPQLVRDDAGDVDRVVRDALDRADHLQHRGHRLGVPGAAGRDDALGPHVVDQLVHVIFELVDLLGHVRIAEVQRRIRKVNHQLGRVHRLGQHRAQVAGLVIHEEIRGHGLTTCEKHTAMVRGRRSARCRGRQRVI